MNNNNQKSSSDELLDDILDTSIKIATATTLLSVAIGIYKVFRD